MPRDKVLRLDQLRNKVAGQLEVEGKSHDVLQMDFATHHDFAAAAEGSADGVEALRTTVQKVVPTLDAETIDRLNMDQAQAIIAFSGAGIEAVERLFPNAVRPESETSPA